MDTDSAQFSTQKPLKQSRDSLQRGVAERDDRLERQSQTIGELQKQIRDLRDTNSYLREQLANTRVRLGETLEDRDRAIALYETHCRLTQYIEGDGENACEEMDVDRCRTCGSLNHSTELCALVIQGTLQASVGEKIDIPTHNLEFTFHETTGPWVTVQSDSVGTLTIRVEK